MRQVSYIPGFAISSEFLKAFGLDGSMCNKIELIVDVNDIVKLRIERAATKEEMDKAIETIKNFKGSPKVEEVLKWTPEQIKELKEVERGRSEVGDVDYTAIEVGDAFIVNDGIITTKDSEQIFQPGDGYEYRLLTRDEMTNYRCRDHHIPKEFHPCARRHIGQDDWFLYHLSDEEGERIFNRKTPVGFHEQRLDAEQSEKFRELLKEVDQPNNVDAASKGLVFDENTRRWTRKKEV